MLAGEALEEHPDEPKTKGVKFSAANGTELKYYGNKNVQFVPKDMVGMGW